MLFQTTPEQILTLPLIMIEMIYYDIDKDLVKKIIDAAIFDQGIYEQLEIWRDYADELERDHSLAELEYIIRDIEKSNINREKFGDFWIYYNKDQEEYTGSHKNYKSLSYLAPLKIQAIVGIINLVKKVQDDLKCQ